MRGVRILLFGCVIVVFSLTASRAQSAASDNQQPPAAAMEAFAEGKRLYDAGDKASAVEKFKEAYRLSKNALLLYNIGFVYDELGDATMAVHYYRMFLDKAKTNPKAAGNRKLAEERVSALEAASKQPAAEPEPKPEPKTKPKARPASTATKLVHETVDTAEAATSLILHADAPEGWTVTLHWRKAGDELFQEELMERGSAGTLEARIPSRAVAGAALHYYLEARDGKGEVVGRAGSAESPNLVEIQGDDTPAIVAPKEEDDTGGATNGGWTTKRYLKWSFTGASVVSFTVAVVAYVTWGNYRDTLKDELALRCGPEPVDPCTPTTDYELELRDGRNMWRNVNWATLGLGVATAGAAGYFWWADRDPPKPQAVTATPIISPDFVGASAILQF